MSSGGVVDVQFVEQVVLTVVGAVVSVAVPIVSTYFIKHLGIQNDAATATRVETGVNAVAQLALGEISKVTAEHPTIDVKNTAVANAMTQVSGSLQTAAKTLGITDDVLKQRVQGALTAMLTPTPPAVQKAASVPTEPAPAIGKTPGAMT